MDAVVCAAIVGLAFQVIEDFSVQCLRVNDYYVIFTLIMLVLMLTLTIYIIVKIRKWSREGTLSETLVNP